MSSINNKLLKRVLETYRQIDLLTKALYLADWDMQVNMPAKATRGRAQMSAYLTELIADRWLDLQLKENIAALANENLTATENALYRNLVRTGEIYIKVPKKLLAKRAQVTAEAVAAWQEARSQSDFSLFKEHLARIIEIHRQIPEFLGYKEHPYDALLNQFEPGLTTAEVEILFDTIKEPVTRLHKKLVAKRVNLKMTSRFDINKQKELSSYVMKLMNFDLTAGRLDETAHPFCTTLDNEDIRITTKYHANDMRSSLMSVMHESGHALYEQGLPEKHENTPLGQAASYGVHESQSRLWENLVGRDPDFLKYFFPKIKRIFGSEFKSFGASDFILYMNEVKNTPIRIEADEVAYNLHIILRFQLERDIIAGTLSADDLPSAWTELSQKLIGVTPKNDSYGVLQDIHWSYGNFGYFPTYALGNMYAAQIMTAMKKSMPVEVKLKKGDLVPILAWLRENIHQFGAYYLPEELIKKATGRVPSPQDFLMYIEDKYTRLFGL